MPRPAEPSRSIGIPSLLTRTSVALVAMTLLAGLVIEIFLLRANFARLEQLIYRDTAGFVANTLVLQFVEHRDIELALEKTERWVTRAIPSAQIVLASSDGEILGASKGCGPTGPVLTSSPGKPSPPPSPRPSRCWFRSPAHPLLPSSRPRPFASARGTLCCYSTAPPDWESFYTRGRDSVS